MTHPAVGFVLGSNFHPSELITVSRALESNGFDSVWCSEDYFLTGGISGAAVVLGATETLKVGTGVLSCFVRHPALTAMETGTLSAAHPGRFRLGLGSGVNSWLDQQGIGHARPLGTMRGYIESVRLLLSGAEVSGEYGGFTFDKVQLAFPPAEVAPVYIGATGPKMTALTGEIADGLLLSVFSTPEFVGTQSGLMAAAGSGADTPISTFALFSLADTVEEARLKARPVVAMYLAAGEPGPMTGAIGINEELAELRKGGAEALARDMPDSWIDALTISGDLDSCLHRMAELGAAGCGEVALAPISVDTMVEDIGRLGAAMKTW
ncbi:LLM class flavin-dependent oxidoreductase [Nakamurella sp. YIM 132087]|uniref:LLM class flavin-dependent oxidoreductase n=1 Tax=Nakamurella alba TaxID=2665158 RepID=A0A7K1FN20_9ACTN|nr:LLM class flavin-dependent oxidoreductase [Nakamurella alba]MTD15480.1 LLM class flavin-dependent oxidoreductase [Nakamurella alba]